MALCVWFVSVRALEAQCVFNAPYIETFDTNSTPSCWTNSGTWMFADLSTSGFPSPDAPGIDDHTGNGGYFAWLDASSSNFGSLTSPAINDSGISALGVSFWYYIYHSNFFPPKNFLAIDFYDGTAWHTLVDTISTNSPYWRYHTIDLGSYTTTDSVRVRFRGIRGNGNQDVLLDDIFIGELPTCLPPQTVLTDTAMASSALIDIIGPTPNLWQYEYGLSGFQTGTGVGMDTTSTTQLHLQNLQPLTKYDVYVRKVCGPGDTSVWYKESFETTCGVYAAPFLETFDTYFTPVCWSNYSFSGNFDFSFSAFEDHTGNGGHSAEDMVSDGAVLETPLIDVSSLAQPALVFWLKLRKRSQELPGYSTAQLKVEVSSDKISWFALDSFDILDFNWQKKILNLQGSNLGDTLAIRFITEDVLHTQGQFVPQVNFDDVSIQDFPACPLPQDSLWFTGIGTTTATVNSFQNNALQIEYGKFGFERGSGTLLNLSGGASTLANLQPGAFQTVYFRDSCGGGFGPWSLPLYFKTPCPQQKSIPYAESFNAIPFQSTDFDAACWSTYGTGNTPWIAGGSAELFTGPGGNIERQYAYTEGDSGSQGDISYLESPWIDMSQANFPYMTFYYFMYGSHMGDLCVEIFDGNTWDTIPNFLCLQGQQQTSDMQPWLLRIIDLAGYSDTIKIRFKATRGPGKYSDICIDKLAFFDTCLVPDPVASFNFNLDSLTSSGQYVTFTSSSTSAVEYLWDFGDGGTDTGATVQHLYTSNGNFEVQHTALSACDIPDTVTDTVNTTGISLLERGLAELGISVYPNPAQEVLNIIFHRNFNRVKLSLSNSVGKVVYRQNTFDSETSLNVSGLPAGVYVLSGSWQGQRFSKKIVIY